MLEGRPHILIVGGADTGRAPLLAVLLRRELAGQASVASAGVVAHAGEPADSNVQLALEQAGIQPSSHIARHLDDDALRGADFVLAVDRGAARVAKMRTRQPVAALSELAGSDDVPDPHRMPLGVWIATMRAYEEHLAVALPTIRGLAKIGQAPADETLSKTEQQHAPAPTPRAAASGPRDEHIQRIARLLDTARVLPEIVDWSKLAQEATERLRAISATAEGPADLTPAATAMLSGLLLQASQVPDEARLELLLRAVEQLREPVDAARLAEIGQIVARWNA